MNIDAKPTPFGIIRLGLLACLVWGAGLAAAHAATATVAVAANFTATAKKLAGIFEQATGNKVEFSFGSTGQLYAQISQGAPFDVFLAADQARPKKAVAAGYAVPGSEFTYATGKVVLYSARAGFVTGKETLTHGTFNRIAIANPVAAPYGAAAVETMKKLGVYASLAPKIVQGENITQTYQFVATGNAQLGFVALSQLAGKKGGSRWVVPADLYTPIAQDAVLLQHGAKNPAARAFVQFLKGPQARAVEAQFGYGAGTP